ncbi:MAG: hypothetical protein VW644_02900, partial [Alphaproteobacteria bacterium]
MTSLIPISNHQIAPYARAVEAHIEPSVSAPSDDGRGWARAQTRGDPEGSERPRVETLLPPGRSIGGAHDTHAARYRDDRSDWHTGRPSAAFFAQYLSQEALPEEVSIRDTSAIVAKYPSLDFDVEILSPGEAASYRDPGLRRVD